MTDTRLPLFPLPLVLYPGATLPLHVFEPRYRALLADCRQGDGRFGIVCALPPLGQVAPGLVGCIAELRDVQSLPDGRSNIVVGGAERFVVRGLPAQTTPYLVAEVAPHEDRDEPDTTSELRRLDGAARALFERVARAARTLSDERDTPLPSLPRDPAALAFAIAAVVDFDLPVRQEVLASRSPLERLRTVHGLLERAAGPIEERAAVKVRAKSNGHGPHHASS